MTTAHPGPARHRRQPRHRCGLLPAGRQPGWDVAVNYTRDAAAAERVAADVRAPGGAPSPWPPTWPTRRRCWRCSAHRRRTGPAGRAGQQRRRGRPAAAGGGHGRGAAAPHVRHQHPGQFPVRARGDPAHEQRHAAAPSSTCRRRRPGWARPGSMWTTPPARARSTPSRWAWRVRWRPRASASTACGRASSTPTSTPAAACPTARRNWRRRCRCNAARRQRRRGGRGGAVAAVRRRQLRHRHHHRRHRRALTW
jgi:hypothetical protein